VEWLLLEGGLKMKTLLQLLIGVIIFLTQSDVVMIVDMSAGLSRTEQGVASAQIADNRIEAASVHLSQIQALLGNALPAHQPMPRISPISIPIPKRGPVK
jgi:hypothetical protein